MRVQRSFKWRSKAVVLAAAATACFAVAASAADNPPPGGAPKAAAPAVGGLPVGFPGPEMFPKPELSPIEKLVESLPPPTPGSLPPLTPLTPDSPMPGSYPRDLQGTWVHNQSLSFRIQEDMYGSPLPYNMTGAKLLARRVTSLTAGKPYLNASTTCRPPGPEWQTDLNFPFQIFQTPKWIEIIFEEYHGRWDIFLDPAAAPDPGQKPYMGRSIGHWDGSTLVVETKGFRQGLWLDVDGTPVSADGTLISRIRKVDLGDRNPYLEIVTTVIDPKYYTQPWVTVHTFGWQPGLTKFSEYNCEEQVGDPDGSADAGLIPEPKD